MPPAPLYLRTLLRYTNPILLLLLLLFITTHCTKLYGLVSGAPGCQQFAQSCYSVSRVRPE